MATAEDIRDVMHDEYPHLKPSIPEIGRFVKCTYFDPDQIYFTLEIDKKSIEFVRGNCQVITNYELIPVGNATRYTLALALNNNTRINSPYSWEYVDSA